MTELGERTIIDVAIANGAALSGEVNVGGKRIVGVIMPAAWSAAALSLQALIDEPSALPKVPVWGEVMDQAGAAVAISATQGNYNIISPLALPALGRIRVRSGTSGVPVNQGAARVVKLVCIPA